MIELLVCGGVSALKRDKYTSRLLYVIAALDLHPLPPRALCIHEKHTTG